MPLRPAPPRLSFNEMWASPRPHNLQWANNGEEKRLIAT